MDIIIISTDKSKLDIHVIHNFLSTESYWAKNIPIKVVEKSIENSLCFGVYYIDQQIGFARLITDYSTFAYLADVFILTDYRGKGLSKLLMKKIKSYPDLQDLRRWLLGTADAHDLYRKFDFTPLSLPERFMEIRNADIYKNH